MNDFERSLLVASVIGVIWVLFYSASIPSQEGKGYSILYLKPGSYQNTLSDYQVSFTYGVEFHEQQATDYQLNVYAGEQLVDQFGFRLDKQHPRREESLSYPIDPSKHSFPLKVRVELSANGVEYSTYFMVSDA